MSTASHSGPSHSGHSHSGHGLSGNAMAEFAGLDAYAGFSATGMLAEGMLHNREAIVGALRAVVPNLPIPAGDPPGYKSWMACDFPPLDQPQHMARWAPHIRTHILDFELLSSLRFTVPCQDTACLHDASGNEIVTLIRPPIEVFPDQVEKVMEHAILREDRMAWLLRSIFPAASRQVPTRPTRRSQP